MKKMSSKPSASQASEDFTEDQRREMAELKSRVRRDELLDEDIQCLALGMGLAAVGRLSEVRFRALVQLEIRSPYKEQKVAA